MKIIAFTKQNPKYESKHPEEDSFKYCSNKKEILVAISDGITRDTIGGDYPKPSPAKKAADLFCESFIRPLKNKKIDMGSIKKSFIYINKKIWELNKKYNPKPDYLGNDFWACVGIGGVIKNNLLYYGFIADCGVCIFDKNGKLKFRTKNEGPNTKGSIDEDVAKKYKTSFKFSEGRKVIRSFYRNNPQNPLSYGAFTGEENALYFLRTGKSQLDKRDYVLFYSDGMSPIIYSKRFNISEHFNNLEDYIDKNSNKIDGGEGTVVAIKI